MAGKKATKKAAAAPAKRSTKKTAKKAGGEEGKFGDPDKDPNKQSKVPKMDGKMTDKAGKRFAFEMLLNDASFERIALPYRQNLERIGVDMNVRTVDTAQFKRREDEFDFDMMSDGFGQSLSPGNEQRDFWGSKAAETAGSRNTAGIKDPSIDRLIEQLIAAPDRESLIAVTRALDRVLQWGFYSIPELHALGARIAYWDRFGRPATLPKHADPSSSPLNYLESWWIDPAKDAALRGKQSPAAQ